MATFSSLRSSIKGFKGNNQHLVWKKYKNQCNISYIQNNEIITREYYESSQMIADLTEYYLTGILPEMCWKLYKDVTVLEFVANEKIAIDFLSAFREQQDRSVGMSQIPYRKDIESVFKFYNHSENRII